MKSRGIMFGLLLILSLIFLYMQPVWFPPASKEPEKSEVTRGPSATTLAYETISTDGFARWIGQDLSEFEQEYGASSGVYPSGYSFMIHQYHIEENGLLEVNTVDNRITSIKTLGTKGDQILPFKFGMTMNDLVKIAMIYPNFSLNYEGQTIELELMEDDMNYRPLVAFDNGSFAMLFFRPDNASGESTLDSVAYVDLETLLKLRPYLVTSGVLPSFDEDPSADWETVNHSKQLRSKELIQLLRTRDQLSPYAVDTELQITSERILSSFFSEPEEFLTTERVQQLYRIQKRTATEPFTLNRPESEELLSEFSLNAANLHIELPVYDPMFSILSWYSIPYMHTKYMHQKPEALAIAFSKENVVVLLQQIENKTEDSDIH